jgi:hypothetical protein
MKHTAVYENPLSMGRTEKRVLVGVAAAGALVALYYALKPASVAATTTTTKLA